MSIVTIEIQLRSDDSEAIADTLEAIANRLSDVGYDDGEFEHATDTNNNKFNYRVIRGYSAR